MIHRRRKSREMGAGFAEAVIGTPLFVVLMIASIQMMLMAWRSLSVQFVATQAIRELTQQRCVPENDPIPTGGCTKQMRLDYLRNTVYSLSHKYGMDINAENSTVCAYALATNPDGLTDSDPSCRVVGDPGDLVSLRIEYRSPIAGPSNMKIGGVMLPQIPTQGLAMALVEYPRT